MGKYDELKFELFPEDADWGGDWIAKPQGYFRGETYMPHAHYHVGFQVFTAPLEMETPHFHHHAEEYMVFVGAKFPDFYESFDADIYLQMGKDPDHMETIHFNKPSVVRIPPNVWHCPIKMVIRKPMMFQATYLAGTWARIGRRVRPDGTYEYIFDGDNIRMCKLRPGEKCVMCGKCMGGKANVSFIEEV